MSLCLVKNRKNEMNGLGSTLEIGWKATVLVGKVHCIELPFKNVFLLKVAQLSSRIGIS